MTNLLPDDKSIFEAILRDFDNVRKTDAPEELQKQLQASMSQLGDIAANSDLLQKVIMQLELQVMRTNRPEALSSAILFFMMVGCEIGALIYKQRGDDIFAPVPTPMMTAKDVVN